MKGKPKTGQQKKCEYCSNTFYCQNYLLETKKFCSRTCYTNAHRLTSMCQVCHEPFGHIKGQDRKICSRKCLDKWNSIVQSNKLKTKCLICKIEFEYQPNEKRKYCSRNCANLSMEKNYSHICFECGNEFSSKQLSRKYCSVKCLCINNNKNGKSFNKKTNTKPEKQVASILDVCDIDYIQSYSVKYGNSYKVYDFYIPSKNLLIEVDGTYWHAKNIKRKDMNETQLHNRKNDIVKNRLAKKNGYKLIRLWSDEVTTTKVMEILNG